MMPLTPIPDLKLFLNYRQDDHQDFVALIYEELIRRCPQDNVFWDAVSVPNFAPFKEMITDWLPRADVLIVIIGPRWVEILKERHAEGAEDFVLYEIKTAAALKKRIAPILIKDAKIPEVRDAPTDSDWREVITLLRRVKMPKITSISVLMNEIELIMRDLPPLPKAVAPPTAAPAGGTPPNDSADALKPISAVMPIPYIAGDHPSTAEINEPSKRSGVAITRSHTRASGVTWQTAVSNRAMSNAGEYVARGIDRHRSGLIESAIVDFEQAIRLNPNVIDAYLHLAAALIDKEDFAAAEQKYITVTKLRPTAYDAYFLLGHLRARMGKWKEAEVDYTAALRIDGSQWAAYLSRGRMRYQLKRYPDALKDFNQALELDHHNIDAYIGRGKKTRKLKTYPGAIEDLQTALALDERSYDAHFQLGVTYHDSGQRDAALQQYTLAISLNPRDPTAYFNRGSVYYMMERYEAALDDYCNALRNDPLKRYVDAYYNRGLAWEKLNQFGKAAACYQRCIDEKGDRAYDAGTRLVELQDRFAARPYIPEADTC